MLTDIYRIKNKTKKRSNSYICLRWKWKLFDILGFTASDIIIIWTRAECHYVTSLLLSRKCVRVTPLLKQIPSSGYSTYMLREYEVHFVNEMLKCITKKIHFYTFPRRNFLYTLIVQWRDNINVKLMSMYLVRGDIIHVDLVPAHLPYAFHLWNVL